MIALGEREGCLCPLTPPASQSLFVVSVVGTDPTDTLFKKIQRDQFTSIGNGVFTICAGKPRSKNITTPACVSQRDAVVSTDDDDD